MSVMNSISMPGLQTAHVEERWPNAMSMVQYDKEKLRIIYDKLWMLDNYANSLFKDYPSAQHRPFNAPSFELEMLMPVKKNFLKPDGSEDDSYIAATDLQEKGGIVNTKEDSDGTQRKRTYVQRHDAASFK